MNLQENMRRFNTKNLNEQAGFTSIAGLGSQISQQELRKSFPRLGTSAAEDLTLQDLQDLLTNIVNGVVERGTPGGMNTQLFRNGKISRQALAIIEEVKIAMDGTLSMMQDQS